MEDVAGSFEMFHEAPVVVMQSGLENALESTRCGNTSSGDPESKLLWGILDLEGSTTGGARGVQKEREPTANTRLILVLQHPYTWSNRPLLDVL